MEIRMIAKGKELRGIGADAFRDFINPIIGEKAYILMEKKVTLAEEEKWLEGAAKEIERGDMVKLVLRINGKIAGVCDAKRGRWKERNNLHFGLAIAKEYRGKGYGEMLLRKTIAVAKKKMKPHKIWIEHIAGNEGARKLYEKVGFREVARLREYVNHYGQWKDKVLMEYTGQMPKGAHRI